MGDINYNRLLQRLIARILLSPFSLLYGIGVWLRNVSYDTGLLKATKFSIPVINVGNLSVGGQGKSPHVEYLVELLKPYIDVATLSRGYMRKTKGFRLAKYEDTAETVGDEPIQYKRKYKDLVVAVSESRNTGIPMILQHHPNVQTILLDDAYQHRAVTPGLNILLTQYSLPFTRDHLLPVGRLREWKKAYRRADIIIITKCPDKITQHDKDAMETEIEPFDHQKIYFSKYEYHSPYHFINTNHRLDLDKAHNILLISAIANTDYLLDYLEPRVDSIQHLEYEDHHIFTEEDLRYQKKVYDNMEGENNFILTTEKDAMRLEPYRQKFYEWGVQIYILPIKVKFLFDEQEKFNESIKDFLLKFKV